MGRIISLALVISAFTIVTAAAAIAADYSGPIYRQGANDIAIAGDYAFCATATGLQVIDISNPSRLKPIAEYNTANGAAAVGIWGHYAFLAAWDSGLEIINIANPHKPSLVATYATDSFAGGLFIRDDYIYLACGYSGFQIIDISNPVSPRLVGDYKTSGYAFKVAVEGDYAFVHDLNNGLMIIDIKNPGYPNLINSYNTEMGISDFCMADNQIYIAESRAGLSVIDYSDIWNLRQVGEYAYPEIENVSFVNDYILCAGNSGIIILDVNRPDKPQLVGEFKADTRIKRVTGRRADIYLAACSGLIAVDLTNPSSPAAVSAYNMQPVNREKYGLDPYVSMPGVSRHAILDEDQDGRDFVLQGEDVYIAGRAGNTDAWQVFFMKADTSGAEDFSRDYGPWTLYDAAFCLTGTNDGDFVLGGKVQPALGMANDDILLHKVNAAGDSIWNSQYDLAGAAYNGNGFDRLWDIIELPGGDLIGCGMVTTHDFPIDPLVLPDTHKDAGLLRFNSLGEIYWVQDYGSTTSTENARACMATSDGNLAFTGYYGYHYDDKCQTYIVKTDMNGAVIWDRAYGDSQKWHSGNWIGEADDGNYIIAGEIETSRAIDGLVMKVSADDGDVIWQKEFGGQYLDSFLDAVITESGDIILAGYKTIDDEGKRIPWIVKVNENGHYICEIDNEPGENSSLYFGLEGPLDDRFVLTGNLMNPYDVFIAGSDLAECEPFIYSYLPGDANMSNGQWPPQIIGGDVTYLVGYFRGINGPCLIGGFYNSADVNGDCSIIGSDVTRLVSYFRGAAAIDHCPDYTPAWLTPGDCPTERPDDWPGCE
jgi:hypothetical protein